MDPTKWKVIRRTRRAMENSLKLKRMNSIIKREGLLTKGVPTSAEESR